MKVCKQCGHVNPDNATKCEDCNRPLTEEKQYIDMKTIREGGKNRPTDRKIPGDFDPKATLREGSLQPAYGSHKDVCPKCGMPLEDGVCPRCGEVGGDSPKPQGTDADEALRSSIHMAAEARKTVRPHRKEAKEGTFSLTPISEETGEPDGEPIRFEGDVVSLNRENTDPKNKTITSKEQARIVRENGAWSIQDSSDYKTTFVQAKGRIAIEPGTLILLGNQLYEFNS